MHAHPTPPRSEMVIAGAVATATILLLVGAPDALAAGADDIGKNLGDLLATWAKSLFSGVVALISIIFLFNRRYNELALFLAAGVLVGGLIFAPTTIAAVIRAIWTTIGS